MNNRRVITFILLLVILLAIVIQLARSEFVFKIQENDKLNGIAANERQVFALSGDEINQKERDNYFIVIDSNEKNSILLKDQVAMVLQQMKKDFAIQDIAYNQQVNTDKGTIIICISKLDNIKNIDAVMNYVKDGGRVFFTVRPELDNTYHRIYRKLGITEGIDIVDADGIKLLTDIYIKGKGISLGEDFINNSSIAVTLDKSCRIHAVSSEKVPLIWDLPYGNGKIMVFNGTMLNEKRNRGIITGGLSLLGDDYIYPVLNLEVVFIDDFPAPFPEGYNERIYEKYGRSIKIFFRDVWWPDMLRIMAAYNLKYTGGIIMSYDNIVAPPFPDFSKADTTNLFLYGRELLKNGGELAMHGYNHQSLVTKGDPKEKYVLSELKYNIFADENSILKSIETFNKYLEASYPNYNITDYIPPSNVLGSVARKVLKKGLPHLETISSEYYNNIEKGAYDQEFEIAGDGILEFPRLTYGYVKDELNDWAVLNGINCLGVFSHFCHPDDILDAERSENKSWDDLSREFDGLLKLVNGSYPWIRRMTITTAGNEARKMLSAKTFIDYRQDRIMGYIDGYPGDYYFILRTGKKAYALENCEVRKIDEDIYLICAKKMNYTIGLQGG